MLTWKTRKVNDIDTNPLECWWAVGMIGDSARLFTIVPQYPNVNGDGYTVDSNADPELYVLFETLGGEHFSKTRLPGDYKSWLQARLWDEYTFERNKTCFVRAFKTLDEAKARAQVQIDKIAEISDAYFPKEDK